MTSIPILKWLLPIPIQLMTTLPFQRRPNVLAMNIFDLESVVPASGSLTSTEVVPSTRVTWPARWGCAKTTTLWRSRGWIIICAVEPLPGVLTYLTTALSSPTGELYIACHPDGQYWDYYPGALSSSQVTVTHSNIAATKFHQRVPDLRMSFADLTFETTWQGTRKIAPPMAVGRHASLSSL